MGGSVRGAPLHVLRWDWRRHPPAAVRVLCGRVSPVCWRPPDTDSLAGPARGNWCPARPHGGPPTVAAAAAIPTGGDRRCGTARHGVAWPRRCRQRWRRWHVAGAAGGKGPAAAAAAAAAAAQPPPRQRSVPGELACGGVVLVAAAATRAAVAAVAPRRPGLSPAGSRGGGRGGGSGWRPGGRAALRARGVARGATGGVCRTRARPAGSVGGGCCVGVAARLVPRVVAGRPPTAPLVGRRRRRRARRRPRARERPARGGGGRGGPAAGGEGPRLSAPHPSPLSDNDSRGSTSSHRGGGRFLSLLFPTWHRRVRRTVAAAAVVLAGTGERGGAERTAAFPLMGTPPWLVRGWCCPWRARGRGGERAGLGGGRSRRMWGGGGTSRPGRRLAAPPPRPRTGTW